MKQLSGEADRLCETHPDQTDDIRGKQEQIERQWQQLRDKAAERRKLLDDSYYLHRFLSDYRSVGADYRNLMNTAHTTNYESTMVQAVVIPQTCEA